MRVWTHVPFLRAIAITCGITVASAGQAVGAGRVALAIGNSAYQNTAPLTNPSNDARDVSASLQRLGFEVLEGRDLDKRSMERLIREFAIKLAGADIALFFYAGHGVQIAGQNYLVPIDAQLASEGDIDFESLPLSLVLKQMEREAKTSLILLDACRDNPLARTLARAMATRGGQVEQGLAEVRTGVGTLIGFSTQPGFVAVDGPGRNSPYTEALLRHMESPDKDVSAILVEVRNDVLKATEGRQVPWEHTSLTGQVYLSRGTAENAPASVAEPPRQAAIIPNYDKEMEISFWNSVRDSKSPVLIGTYLDRYPNGNFASLARAMVAQLTRGDATSADSPKVAALPLPETKIESSHGSDPRALARSLQTELKRVGCDPGNVDGVWDADARDALEEFTRLAKLSLPTSDPSTIALEAVSAQKERVCPLQCDRGEAVVGGRCVARSTGRPSKHTKRTRVRSHSRHQAVDEHSAKGKGMCWSQHGRHFEVAPCY
jgi:hypothetical protein